MKSEELMNAIGEIREDWIDDARRPVRRRYRFPVIAAAILLCMTLTVSALAAADVEGVYEVLYALSPTIAQKLKPVQLSCVDNGIELTVISADVEGDTARVFVGLRDLEGDRVDGTCDLYDSYDINLPADLIGCCMFEEFDEETRTALFLVEITRGDGKPIRGDKLTFSLREFLSGSREYYDFVDLDLTRAEMNPAVRGADSLVRRGYSASDEFDPESVETILNPDGALAEPLEGVTIAGMGYVDGRLHIQIHYENGRETDAHGGVSLLKEADSAPEFDLGSISFFDESMAGYVDELIFDIPPEELENYRAFGYFEAADALHRGNWEITFPLE